MWVDAERLAFVGPMGTVMRRRMGSVTIYLGLEQPFRFRIDGQRWRETRAAMVPPLVPHGFVANDQLMAALMIEPEAGTFKDVELDDEGVDILKAVMLQTYREMLEHGPAVAAHLDLFHCEHVVLNKGTVRPPIDLRIVRAVERIRATPYMRVTASQLADQSDLSFSRFVHLFREQTGLTFRNFVAWKRARGILETLDQHGSLTRIAEDTGFPDLSYFSNTVRHTYGLAPREMFARCAQATISIQATGRVIGLPRPL